MKKWFARLPVHQKLVAMALIVTTGALMAATAGLIALDVWRYRNAASEDIVSLAQVIAENSAAALAFDDPDAAAETLATTRLRPTVTRACIYRPDGMLFAAYSRANGATCTERLPQPATSWRRFSRETPVMRNRLLLGTVYAERDLSDLGSRIALTAAAGLTMLVLAATLAFAVAHRLHRSVSTPIVQLAAAARDVGSESFSLPEIRTDPDEIGELVRALTGMMSRVQQANQGLMTEIAERRRIEAERETLLVREREASRVKDEFLAAVSHELRTPLNAILGWVQILKMGPPDPDTTSKAVTTIARNAHTQARLIEDLVDVSRIVTGKLHLRFEAVDLRLPVEAAAEVIRPSARAKNVSLDLKLPATSCFVSGDSDRLQQVISNLLSNACKFSSAGGAITVTLEHTGGAYEVRITDRGSGISKEFLPLVFDRFSQSDGSMTREHGGLGLGLAIVKELTELHGGVVTAESPGPGQGATFTIRLPALIGLDDTTMPAVPAEAPPAQTLSGVRVLAVDDNADAVEILSAALGAAGATVSTVTSGADAILEWRRQPYDVLICDLAMPQMNGFDVLRHLRNSDEAIGRPTVAIALSAHASAAYVARCYEAGFVQHLSKPFATADLVHAIASALPQIKD